MSASKRFPFLAAMAITLVAACSGPDADIAPDDFIGDEPPDGFGSVGSSGVGFFPGECAASPAQIHASLAENGVVIRLDAKEGVDVGADPVDVSGVLGGVDGNGFTVDACALKACDQPELYRVELSPGLIEMNLLEEGVFVRLRYLAQDDGAFAVVLENLATLDGMVNPIDDGGHVVLEAMSGFVDDAPFTASFTLSERCYTVDGTLTARGMYVAAEDDPGERIEVQLGTTVPWTITTGKHTGSYDLWNLSSYVQGNSPMSSLLVSWH
ncbi:MAG: hypothetical protein U0414_07030 [Polyangiaceae bacterium]